MPASFSVSSGDYRWLIGKMKELDKEIFNQMRRDFRSEIRPFSRNLASNIPTRSPLSGLAPGNPYARQSLDERAPWLWKKPSVSIDVGGRPKKRAGKPTEAVVRLRFNDRRPYSVFSILERRKGGKLPEQVARGGYAFGDRGRWVIPQFYKRQAEMASIAQKILVDYSKRFSAIIARRFS